MIKVNSISGGKTSAYIAKLGRTVIWLKNYSKNGVL